MVDNSDIKTVVRGNSEFAFDLYKKLKEVEDNLFFAPHSISTALAMAYAGAQGNTEKQMAQILYFALNQERLHPALAAVEAKLNDIQAKGDVQLNIASALWPQQGYPFLETFLSLIKEYYGGSITPVDYKSHPEEARNKINRWVEEKTKDKIKELIAKGVLDALTRLVLVNAIYFKGNWAAQFNPRATKEALFWLTSGTSTAVSMMAQTRRFNYDETDKLQILELPYIGNMISMILLLPKKRDGLAEVENSLTLEKLAQWTTYLFDTEVEVLLPKFKMSSRFRLDNTLSSLGVVDAFDPLKANFAGMNGQESGLYIGAVIHQAFVEVNEEGTEAAAATAIGIKALSLGPPLRPPTFRADHPFIFLIRDNKTGSILFMGRVANPGK